MLFEGIPFQKARGGLRVRKRVRQTADCIQKGTDAFLNLTFATHQSADLREADGVMSAEQ